MRIIEVSGGKSSMEGGGEMRVRALILEDKNVMWYRSMIWERGRQEAQRVVGREGCDWQR